MGKEDRYGYAHREDSAHDVGDSMPDDVGDSKGTFHDRARQDSNVIVEGEAQSIDTYQRSSAEAKLDEASSKKSEKKFSSPASSGESISQKDAEGKVVTLTVDSTGGTLDGIAQYKNHQVHVGNATTGETIRVRLEKGQGFLIGRRIKVDE
jgi:predicted RNA-binding protein with TRAM domain